MARRKKPTQTLKKQPPKTISLKLDRELHNELLQETQEQDTDISKYARKALREKLARSKKATAWFFLPTQ